MTRWVPSAIMLRWGILGVNTTAEESVGPAMRSVGHDLAVVSAETLTAAQQFAATQGVRRARRDHAEVLVSRDVDAVFVALPTSEREHWVTEALHAGKHVLCLKPLSIDADGAARMAAAAASGAGLTLMEALPLRFHPRTAALLELVRSGGIGAVRLVSATSAYPMTDADSYHADPSRGGGALLDVGADLVSLIRWVLGEEPDVVRAVTRRWASGADATTSAVMGFPSGATAALHASFDSARHSTLEIVGSDGTLRMPRPFTAGPGDQAALLRSDEVIGTWRADPWERLLEAFEHATQGIRPPIDVEDAVATAHVIDWIAASG
ncbi:Gfo/Idh/MocA family protein [Euzebya pacifica]|uniref:Gfo/Idh/MocA family protein n=1 Tax=Euzebya pacifica TaxID=1608957 RepID=UPI0013DEC7B8|nr:Gfo/Idh/MocA family oxidoreductase [Euzebya pacifica]